LQHCALPISSSLTSSFYRRRVQVMKLLIMQFSPAAYYFIDEGCPNTSKDLACMFSGNIKFAMEFWYELHLMYYLLLCVMA
jgi:hypothetical protein